VPNGFWALLVTFVVAVLLAAVFFLNNRQMEICTSGGVELLDVHANVATRRKRVQPSPVLQSVQFIPYDERSLASSHLGSSVLEYAETCAGYVLERMQLLLSSNVEDGLHNLKLMRQLVDETSWTPADDEKLTEYLSSPDSVALKTLEKIFAVSQDDAFAQNINSIVSASWADIASSDCLVGFARSDRCFKTCLDVVLENIPSGTGDDHIRIVECDAGTGQAYTHVIRQLALHPFISVSYIAADPVPTQSIDAELAMKLGIETVEWSLEGTRPVPTGLASGADLVVLANVLHRHDNISRALSAASSLVGDNGFLLIAEATSNFAIPWSFFALTHDVSQMSDISSRTCGPYCDERTWTTLLANAGLTVVAQKSDGILYTVFLCRKLSHTSLTQVPRIIDVDDESFQWLEEIKSVMAEDRNEPDTNVVWLRAKTADNGLIGMMNCLRREPNGDRLR